MRDEFIPLTRIIRTFKQSWDKNGKCTLEISNSQQEAAYSRYWIWICQTPILRSSTYINNWTSRASLKWRALRYIYWKIKLNMRRLCWQFLRYMRKKLHWTIDYITYKNRAKLFHLLSVPKHPCFYVFPSCGDICIVFFFKLICVPLMP